MSSPCSLSCTVVLQVLASNAETHDELHSHTICDLLVPVSTVQVGGQSEAAPIHSVKIQTLLDALFHTNLTTAPLLLAAIFANPSAHPHLSVSTTRIPIFDSRKASPGFGYRRLGLLSDVTSGASGSVSVRSIDRQDSWTLPEIQLCRLEWLADGLDLGRHFLLILSNDTATSTSGALLSIFDSFDALVVENNSTLFNLPDGINDVDLSLFETALSPFFAFFASPPASGDAAQSTPKNIDAALRKLGIAIEDISPAHLGSSAETRSLWQVYQKISTAEELLKRLGLTDLDTVDDLGDGGAVSSRDVLDYLGWTWEAFQEKKTLFENMRIYGQNSRWNPQIPHDELYHRRWRGLVAMFSPGGYCDGRTAPRACPQASSSEKVAAELSESSFVNGGVVVAVQTDNAIGYEAVSERFAQVEGKPYKSDYARASGIAVVEPAYPTLVRPVPDTESA
uniref:Uncharacterized protein n=1 Tax=Mycena chlorophos TaxID=658473 RepID=A0ABQ0L540_MYCCL|nr:predicted protein [Mycena chlorophos]